MGNSSHPWLNAFIQTPQIRQLVQILANFDPRSLTSGARSPVAQGCQGSAATLLAGAVALVAKRCILLVVAHLDDADNALEDLSLFSEAGYDLTALRFGALEVLPGESRVSLDLLAERLAVVEHLHGAEMASPRAQVIVAPIQALMQAVAKPQVLDQMTLILEPSDHYPPGELAAWLTQAGYQRLDAIEQPGDFALRGGIVDIYPPGGTAQEPVRLDYFGDEIERICQVDPQTLGSGQRLDKVQLVGANLEQLQNDDQTTGLWSLLPPDAAVLMHEMMELSEQARGYFERLTNPVGIYPPGEVFRALTALPHVQVNQYSSVSPGQAVLALPVHPLVSFAQDAAQALCELGELTQAAENQVVVLCPREAERQRLEELVTEHVPDQRQILKIEQGELHRGFCWNTDHQTLILVPHQELFHRYEIRRSIRRPGGGQGAGTRATDAFLDLNPGDYVVHIDHGIALLKSFGVMPGKKRSQARERDTAEECLTLEFAGGAVLHVPVTQIDRVSRYVGGFEGKPPLSKLGGKRWEKQKQQVENAVKDLASQLLRVQAARQAMPGIAYPPDTPWQAKFEAEFPFQETEDQLAAIAAVKQDMSISRPMDRLICGDVGFGKTEIAIRAAFKTVQYGKQVAVLVPTTVLAEQHERTFTDRMADYPIRIESISRFKTVKEQKQSIERLAHGQIDIIIGTHRLLSKDIRFADLGLLIIDEEQRFGVEHKNKLLQFRLTADVMTLSATPIPRTLHMSMLGLRDISSLTTPPADRRAIVTEVMSYNPARIKQAIARELNRQGQVFFLHNRVRDIQAVAQEVRDMAPGARVIVGHGQMAPHELEKVMFQFIHRQADILVCTTIIESGIDIPTANTILINHADHFGLAELHQLRGRVGRYKHRAYCYLMLPADRPVNDKAVKRLRALEQYAMLGAGFKIAMRDLEIRGAGNLLGAEQSGHIAAVGYDMYCQLLEHAARRLRQEPTTEPTRTHLELPLVGRLPKNYIPSDKFRMETYRRLSRARTMAEFDAVVQDIHDAYGKPPAMAQNCIDLLELRLAAALLDIQTLKLEKQDLIFRTPQPKNLIRLFVDAPGRASLIDQDKVYYRPPANYLKPASTLLAVLRKLLIRPVREKEAAPSPDAAHAK